MMFTLPIAPPLLLIGMSFNSTRVYTQLFLLDVAGNIWQLWLDVDQAGRAITGLVTPYIG